MRVAHVLLDALQAAELGAGPPLRLVPRQTLEHELIRLAVDMIA